MSEHTRASGAVVNEDAEASASKDAREAADRFGVPLDDVEGTGADGSVKLEDVERHHFAQAEVQQHRPDPDAEPSESEE